VKMFGHFYLRSFLFLLFFIFLFKITDKNLIKFFDSNTELIKLSMTRNSKAYATETILFLIKNLTNLESLNLTGIYFFLT